MGRPAGTKNVMRTPEEKERLIKDIEKYIKSIGGNCD